MYESALARIDVAEKELDGIYTDWQRDRGKHIRLEAQIAALQSLGGDLAAKSGVSVERFAICFQERFLYLQDKWLTDMETQSPGLAAQIDTRAADEIPTGRLIPLSKSRLSGFQQRSAPLPVLIRAYTSPPRKPESAMQSQCLEK